MNAQRKPPKRMLTGDRPTGRLHLGHLVGTLQNRVRLQNEYETYVIVADLHLLSTRPRRVDVERIAEASRGLVLDYLAAGIDPDRAAIFLQSAIAEVHELSTILHSLVTVNRVARLPSLKDMARSAGIDEASTSLGLLGYPVLQAADILLPRADIVPVGRDNAAHVEITREVARRFNREFGPVFRVPELLVGESLVGTDGKSKMSKSAGNAIFLCDDPDTVARKVRGMFTDPKRVRADIPGTVEGNPLFEYHRAFNDDTDEVAELEQRYRAGKVGDGECKARLVVALERRLSPVRQRMRHYENRTDLLDDILHTGTRRMQAIARETMAEVREAMGYGPDLLRLRA